MPHPLRSSSVVSIQSIFRTASFKAKSINSSNNSTEDAQGLVSILPLNANNSSSIQHLHMLPPIPVTLQPDNTVLEWIHKVQETRPEILLASSPKYFSVNEAAFKDIDTGSVQLNSMSSASLLLFRILNTKIYGLGAKSTYHMSVRIVSNENRAVITSTSCTSSSKTGDLVDSFLM
jgi:hypothetical protein